MTQFAFMSGKGGVGQSFLVANLARAMTASGSPVEVVILAGSPPGLELLDSGEESEGLKLIRERSIDSLTGPSEEGAVQMLDLPTVFEGADLETVARAGFVALVVNPDPASLVGAYRLLRRLVEANRGVQVGLIVNRSDPAQAEAVSQRFKAFAGRHLGCPVRFLGSVRESGAVARAAKTRRFLETAAPRTKALVEIRDIAESLTSWTKPDSARPLLESLKPVESPAVPMAA
ncbi:MAG: hypothetical protein KF884_08030 [Fimbriimonadaceae bacterium]|nr:hypothetical protein [Fimbriimonadaceae bacterium]QYK57498.1 MAG: hypothetical protein KF884_08030 [Fimbriimonadaceae bacterium]